MKASQLILNPNKATLSELIDAHNCLVRHLFASDSSLVRTEPSSEPQVSRFDDPKDVRYTLSDIQAANRLLILWAFRCMCVFPVPVELKPDVWHCAKCSKPYEEPLDD